MPTANDPMPNAKRATEPQRQRRSPSVPSRALPRSQMLALWGLCCGVLWLTMGAAAAKAPCVKLSKKVCQTLGKKAFICMTYKTIARHSQVDQQRCKRYPLPRRAQALG